VTGRRKALIIAVNEYEDPGLRRLRGSAAGAAALAAALGDPRIGEFEVSVVRNQPAYEIQSRLADLFADAKPDDVLLLHFSGLGLMGEAGDLYFAARNTPAPTCSPPPPYRQTLYNAVSAPVPQATSCSCSTSVTAGRSATASR
jgi:Caspase domain